MDDNPLSRRDLLVQGAAGLAVGLLAASASAQAAEPAAAAGTPVMTGASLAAPTWEGRSPVNEAIRAGDDSGCSSYPIYQGTNNHGNYSRNNNPTSDAVEVKMKTLEGAEWGLATGCGMGAISTVLLALLKTGDRLVYHRTTYGGTSKLLDHLRRFGVTCDGIDMSDPERLRTALAAGAARLVFFEVHSNPLNEVIDVRACAELAHASGAVVVVDNTWLSPYLLQPIALGADIVAHSATKYLMGHGNGLAGIVCGGKRVMEPVEHMRIALGTVMAPFNASLLLQGIKTLPMRMERHCANAQRVAEFLGTHGKVSRVHYPGLPSDPGHATARRQVRGFGGMVGFQTTGATKVWERCRHIRPWWSLGDPETLMAPSDYAGVLPQPFMRVSVGLEDPEEIIADLKQALDQV